MYAIYIIMKQIFLDFIFILSEIYLFIRTLRTLI